jgi:hypothetical protein
MTLPAPFAPGDLCNAGFWQALLDGMPGKVLGSANSATAYTSTGTNGVTETMCTDRGVHVTVVAGQNYFIEWGHRWQTTAVGTIGAASVHAAQGVVTSASPVVGAVQALLTSGGSGANENTYRALWVPSASGVWNLQVGVKSVGGTGTTAVLGGQGNAFLTVIQA